MEVKGFSYTDFMKATILPLTAPQRISKYGAEVAILQESLTQRTDNLVDALHQLLGSEQASAIAQEMAAILELSGVLQHRALSMNLEVSQASEPCRDDLQGLVERILQASSARSGPTPN